MAKNGYYAVRVGRHPGIYTRWDECLQEVSGYPGAKYKKFSDRRQAEDFVAGERDLTDEEIKATILHSENNNPGHAIAYVDGSYNQDKNIYGAGVVFMAPLSPLCPEKILFLSEAGTPPNGHGWNINGELAAALLAINKAKEVGTNSLVIYHDYEGIGAWADGAWKTEKEYAREYIAAVQDARKSMNITFRHVKGHSGNKWNEKADELAKIGAGLIVPKEGKDEKC